MVATLQLEQGLNHWMKRRRKLKKSEKRCKVKANQVISISVKRRAKRAGRNPATGAKMRRAKRDGRNPATGA